MHLEEKAENFQDLFNFLEYLNENWKIRNLTYLNQSEAALFLHKNRSRPIEVYHSYEDELPVAIIQLLIIVLVFLIVLFMCKCNKIMRFCRDRKPKTAEELENERYHDKMRFSDYLCSYYYNFKMRRRFKKRRIQRFNNKRNARKFTKSGKFSEFSRNNDKSRGSSIFRRRSVRYRNRNGLTLNEKNSVERKRIAENRLSVIIDLANSINAVKTTNTVSTENEFL
jgi:hypothetical protein